MRKWMRERLQRRKKTPVEPSEQPAPPPLQPAYFDAEQAPDEAPEAPKTEPEISASAPPEQEVRPVRRARSNSEEQTSEEQPSEAPPAARPGPISSGSTGRGRRRRGGRGRGGRGREQAVAQAFTPAAVKGSVPVVPSAPAEEEFANAGDAEEPTVTPSVAAAPRLSSTPAAPQRPPKGVVVLAIGLPGSGK